MAYDINADTTLSSPYESTVVIVSTPPVPISTPAVVTTSPSITPPTVVLGNIDNKFITMCLMSLLAVGLGPIIGISVGGVLFSKFSF